MSSLLTLVPLSPDPAPVWGWVRLRALVLDSVSSAHSRRAYARALDDFRDWCGRSGSGSLTREIVQHYRAHLESRLAPSSLNLHLTVVRKLAHEAAANDLLSPEMAAAISDVKGTPRCVSRLGTWLTIDQAHALLQAPAGGSLRAKRDRALLALLIGCGLRRGEIAGLTVDRIQQCEGRWVVVDVAGKGNHIRNVPMPAWTKVCLDRWTAAAEIASGRLFRAISQKGEAGTGLTAQTVYLIVKGYAEQIGIEVAPHDLRRTFAKLAHRGQSPLEQIQLSLGHKSIVTTERYLGIRQDLADAPCDHLGIELENV